MSEAASGEEVRWLDVPVGMPAEGQVEAFSVEGHALLLCNAEGVPYVLHDECPHVRVSMAGALIRGTLLECPLHGGLMDVRDGSPQGMPIRRPGTCYAVRTEGETLQVAIPA